MVPRPPTRRALALALFASGLAGDQEPEPGGQAPDAGPPPIEAFHTVVFPAPGSPGQASSPEPSFGAPALLHIGLNRLVLVAEVRSDDGVGLVARTSDDDGRSWSSPATILSAVGQAFENPTLLHDPAMGDLHLLSTRDDRELLHMRSQDLGASWSDPVVVPVALPSVVELGVGPGHGLALGAGDHAGRLIAPLWLRSGFERRLAARAIYSDDRGAKWTLGAAVPWERASQGTLCELEDGVVALNLRVQGSERRLVVQSRNGAAEWSEPAWADGLDGPTAQASWIRVDGPAIAGRERLLYAAPARSTAPPGRPMKVYLSGNGGRTWPVFRIVGDARAGYSDLARSPQDTYFLACESAGQIELWHFDIHWLTEAWALYGGPPDPGFDPAK